MTLFDTYGFGQFSIDQFCTAVLILLSIICVLLLFSIFYLKKIKDNKKYTNETNTNKSKEEDNFDMTMYM